ncbi:MAG: hypothetical protein AAFR52_16945 [Pseudomonadota bacterium]
MRFLGVAAVMAVLGGPVSAATLFAEDFDALADGTTATADWTTSAPGLLSGDSFEVSAGRFEANDTNDFATWTTREIDIAGFVNLVLGIDFEEVGDHEGASCRCGVDQDAINVGVSIDNGAFEFFENINGLGDDDRGFGITGDIAEGVGATDADFGTTTLNEAVGTGSTLRLQIAIRNTAGAETIFFDNVTLQGEASVIPLPPAGLLLVGALGALALRRRGA